MDPVVDADVQRARVAHEHEVGIGGSVAWPQQAEDHRPGDDQHQQRRADGHCPAAGTQRIVEHAGVRADQRVFDPANQDRCPLICAGVVGVRGM
ncbi:hypothetical protein WU86_08185 [Corynebacterium xerosis]|nr:hypothetical protein WU86_08185 [Corynebacterium xerosis]